jgi:tRNA A37 threonylcarbamoyladenosine modification protein TsaB
VDVVVVSLCSPLQVGIYENNKLIKEYITKEYTSEALPSIFRELLESFTCRRVFFARGPGSFMAIKITYIFLRTLSITKNIELFASDGFNFNQNSPIKALRKIYFVKKDDKITTQFFENEQKSEFALPKKLEIEKFSKDIEPLYILPAV